MQSINQRDDLWSETAVLRLVSDRPTSWSYIFGLNLGLAALINLVLVLHFHFALNTEYKLQCKKLNEWRRPKLSTLPC